MNIDDEIYKSVSTVVKFNELQHARIINGISISNMPHRNTERASKILQDIHHRVKAKGSHPSFNWIDEHKLFVTW